MSKSHKNSLYGEKDFESLFDAAPDAILLVNNKGEIERLNGQAQYVFGYQPDELIGEPVELLIPQRFRNKHTAHRQDFADNPQARPMGSSLQLYARHKDGSEFPVDVNLSPIRMHGRMIIAAAVRDVTESRRAARELQGANDRLREEKRFSASLVATQQGIVLVLDTTGRISLVNPYFEELTGYRSEQVIGLDWFDTFIPPTERKTIRKLFDVVMREGINRGYANAIVTKSGSERLIQWQSKTLEDDKGRITGLLNTGYDVTEKEAAAQALRDAKEEADRANSIKTRFLAAASHDLRQPLQSLGIYLSLLARRLTDDAARDIAGKMRQSLDTMGELLDKLLDISRLDSGTVEVNRRTFPVQDILDQIAAQDTPHAEDKGLSLRIEPSRLTVDSDPALLLRIVDNFVTNAIRYTESGEVRVDCRAIGGTVRIDVTDTGIGIPSEAIDNIFEEYFQLGNPVRNRSKGLGLGLSIVRHIARLLEHEVTVESTPGKGSTFSVTLPLVGTVSERAPVSQPADLSERPQRSARVLIIDDDPAVIDATSVLLKIEGFEVQAARDAEEALALIDDGLQPNVVVSDYRLPGLNGVDTVRQIRRRAANEIPAIMVTGDTSGRQIIAADLERCTILHKPVDPDSLVLLINEARAR